MERIMPNLRNYLVEKFSELDKYIPNFRLRKILRKQPLVLGIETINVCNARCVFCAYTKIKIKKQIMDMDLYKSIISSYTRMGGGMLSFSPLLGECTLDPLLLERIAFARRYKNIGTIGFHTNAIALKDYSDEKIESLLFMIQVIVISLGGTNRQDYERMFRVDQFDNVHDTIIRLLKVIKNKNLKTKINLDYRVSTSPEDLHLSDHVIGLVELGVDKVGAINTFGNWGGLITDTDLPAGAFLANKQTIKKAPCWVFYLGPKIFADGSVTCCGCADYNGEMVIGSCRDTPFELLWNNSVYRNFRNSFENGKLNDFCRRCSYYTDGEDFSRSKYLKYTFKLGQSPFDAT